MKIRITGHKMTASAGMKKHLDEKLSKFEKYSSRLVESHVILKEEKYFFEAEITLLARHFKAVGEGKSKDNIFAAIDQAADRVEKQLRKYREKLKDHRIPGSAKAKKSGARTGKVSVAALLDDSEEGDE